MLRNVIRNILPWNNSVLYKTKRYDVLQAILNVRRKHDISSQHTTADDEEDHRPIKYSQSKAADMRVDEYRLPHKESMPDYQPPIVLLSLAAFLIYFCILREENDIDELLYVDLDTSLKRIEKQHKEKVAKRA